MCGIAGILSNRLVGDRLVESLQRMIGTMRHRGSDGTGIYTENGCGLAHTRLAVIDTSDAGKQPMTQCGVTLIYNGELYNFQEKRELLEAKGYKFFSHSDTEVLLALYLHYGENCVQHLQGMYAFALWDSREQKLFCARDPLGIKPFLYAETAEGLVFASELKALLSSRLIKRDVDRDSLRMLLERGSVPQPRSILCGVKWLLPGHTLKWKRGKQPILNCFRPLRVGAVDLRGTDWASIVNHGESLLRDAVRRQMIADVPLGAFLSGGIDSSLLVALMVQEHGNVRTFSVGFEGGLETDSEDETDDAAIVAQHLGVIHNRVLVKQREVAEHLQAMVRGLDHPTVDGVNTWFVSRAASQDLTVAISGTGGDELFAGYPWFSAMQIFNNRPWTKRMMGSLQGETFVNAFNAQYHIFDQMMASSLCPGTKATTRRSDPLGYADTLSRVTGLVLSGYTRDQLLADIDTAAMSHGLEVRVPLLDENLLDFALSLPEIAKIAPSDLSAPQGSYAASGVKRLLIEIGCPLLPNGFKYRGKRGFTLPFDSWLRGILQPMMKDTLSVPVTAKRGFFEPSVVQTVLDAFLARQVHWTRPWLLMMTELWAQEVLNA
ncbi:MAG: asparagine synthase (glutamine-hydrolyzing) [Nostoc sp. TH1S01]|nr:asparagine synthase (glutamine-hydrolyzing) [Nostoc sp. TH1S01]